MSQTAAISSIDLKSLAIRAPKGLSAAGSPKALENMTCLPEQFQNLALPSVQLTVSSVGEKLKGSSLKGSFDKSARTGLPVLLPVPAHPPTSPHAPPFLPRIPPENRLSPTRVNPIPNLRTPTARPDFDLISTRF